MAELDEITETRERVCICCGEKFQYPAAGTVHATKFFCENCGQLPPPIRKAFERLNTRIRKLEKLLQKPAAASKPDMGSAPAVDKTTAT
jgi:hypothetical protein